MNQELLFSVLKMVIENGGASTVKQSELVGEWCIVRAYAAGVHYGKVKSIDGEQVILSDSVRLWSWKAADGVALSGLAQTGIDLQKSKIDAINPIIAINGVCEIIPVSTKFKESIKNAYK